MKLPTKIKYILLCFLFSAKTFLAQNGRECIKEVIELNSLNDHKNDSSLKNKSVKVSYTVRVTNWDNETTVSNVKAYKKGSRMHFFSEQVNVYQDEREALLILPQQKVIFFNSMDKKLTDIKLTDAFYEMRNSMLDSCDVISCETQGPLKKLTLKMPPNKLKRNDVHIQKITYDYNIETKKIISIKLDYDSDYKLKQMYIVYKDFVVGAEYSYLSPRTFVMDKKGHLLPKYTGWEFVDNRDQPKN